MRKAKQSISFSLSDFNFSSHSSLFDSPSDCSVPPPPLKIKRDRSKTERENSKHSCRRALSVALQRRKMLRSKRLLSITPRNFNARSFLKEEEKLFPVIPLRNPSQWNSTRFLDFYQMGNKKAIMAERARIKDEMSRGYFADMEEFKEHGGKIAQANKVIVPATEAFKFPAFKVNKPDGSSLELPVIFQENNPNASQSDIPKASLVCLSFRASSNKMIDSWSSPFLKAFGYSSDVRLYEVSFIDSWLLTLSPIKKLLLKVMRKPQLEDKQDVLQRQIVYSFGDNYYFRKELRILNLLTGYIFLLDKHGRIRWQGYGTAAEDEVSSLLFCTNMLLEEE